ncbi:hypothetical protein [Azospirillum doebereinerae]
MWLFVIQHLNFRISSLFQSVEMHSNEWYVPMNIRGIEMRKIFLAGFAIVGFVGLIAGTMIYRDPTWLLPAAERDIVRGAIQKMRTYRPDALEIESALANHEQGRTETVCGSFKTKDNKIWFIGERNSTSIDDFLFSDSEYFHISFWKELCSTETPPDLLENKKQWLLTRAYSDVKSELNDPNSAMFRDVRIFNKNLNSGVCGEVNAKNMFGGYPGYRKFVTTLPGNRLSLYFENGMSFKENWEKHCL